MLCTPYSYAVVLVTAQLQRLLYLSQGLVNYSCILGAKNKLRSSGGEGDWVIFNKWVVLLKIKLIMVKCKTMIS